ncbi:MAG: hypothetical protein EHM43_11010, partial [Ignavibacteriae bacterium]
MKNRSFICHTYVIIMLLALGKGLANDARYELYDAAPIGALSGEPLRIDESTHLYRSGNGRIVFVSDGPPRRYRTVWTQTCGDITSLCNITGGILAGDSEGKLQHLSGQGNVLSIVDPNLGGVTCMWSDDNEVLVGTDRGYVFRFDPVSMREQIILTYDRPIKFIDNTRGLLTIAASPCAVLHSTDAGMNWRQTVRDSAIPISAMKKFNDTTFIVGSVMSTVYTYTTNADSLRFSYRFKYYPPKWDTQTDFIDQIAVNGERVFVTGHILMMTFEYEYVYYTDDGGLVWRQSAYPQEPAGTSNLICNIPRSLSFNDKGVGTLVLHDLNIDANLICTTTDNGVTWLGDSVLIGRLHDSIQFRDVPWPIQRSFREVQRSNNALFAIALRSITNAGTLESVNYETGIFYSQDDGRTWSLRGAVPEVATRFGIHGDSLLIGADSGAVYSSIDAGLSFHQSMTIDTPDYANRVTICGHSTDGTFVAYTSVGDIYLIKDSVAKKVDLPEIVHDSSEVSEPSVRDSLICYSVNRTDQSGWYSESVVVLQLLGTTDYQVVDITSLLPVQLKAMPRVFSGK